MFFFFSGANNVAAVIVAAPAIGPFLLNLGRTGGGATGLFEKEVFPYPLMIL